MATAAVIDACKKDEKRIDAVRRVLPASTSSIQSSPWLNAWFDSGLEVLAKKVLRDLKISGNSSKLYNALWAIQYQFLLAKLPPLKKDVTAMLEVMFSLTRHSSQALPQHLFLKWVAQRMDTEQCAKPALIHEVRRQKGKPSVLYQARLWNQLKGRIPKPVAKTVKT